ncbi:hypothetical protein ABKN59_004995 [Abortiporus biennis]
MEIVLPPPIKITVENAIKGLDYRSQVLWIDQKMKETYERHLALLSYRNVSLMISQLPHEILSEIFLLAISFIEDGIKFSHVCRHWREVALGTPRLWTSMTGSSFRISQLFVSRSRSFPLNVYFHSPVDPYKRQPAYIRNADGYRDFAKAAHSRIRSLKFTDVYLECAQHLFQSFSEFPSENLTRLIVTGSEETLPSSHPESSHVLLELEKIFSKFLQSLDRVGCQLQLLETSEIHSLPSNLSGLYSSLRVLRMKSGSISRHDFPAEYSTPPMAKFIDVLKHFSELTYLEIDRSGPRLPPDQEYPAPATTVHLPKLRALSITFRNPEDIAYLLAVLTFPKDVQVFLDCSDSEKQEGTFPFILPLAEHRPCIDEIIKNADCVSLSMLPSHYKGWSVICTSSRQSSTSGKLSVQTYSLRDYHQDVILEFFVDPLLPLFGHVAITHLQIDSAEFYGIGLWTELFSCFPKLKTLWCSFSHVKHGWCTTPNSDVILEALSRPSSQRALPCLHLKSLQIVHTNLGNNDLLSCLEARHASKAPRLELLQYAGVFFINADSEDDSDSEDHGSEDDSSDDAIGSRQKSSKNLNRISSDNLPDLSDFVDKFEVTTRKHF